MFSVNICIFVRLQPWRLLFNELLNKACHYSLIVTQLCAHYIQVKDNEVEDSESLAASTIYRRALYAGQLNSTYTWKGQFLGSCSVTVIHRVTAIYRVIIYRFSLYLA